MKQLTLIFFLVLSLVGCQDNSTNEIHADKSDVSSTQSESSKITKKLIWNDLIETMPSSKVFINKPIIVNFTDQMSLRNDVNISSLITIKPKVSFSTRFNKNNKYQLLISGDFKEGETYEVKLQPKGFNYIKSSLKAFDFKVDILPISSQVILSALKTNTATPNKVFLTGALNTNTPVLLKQVKGLIEADIIGSEPSLVWNQKKGTSSQQFTFVLSGIEKKTQENTLIVKIADINHPAKKVERKIKIPALHQFSLLSVKLNEQQNIEATFSQPLSKKNDYKSLLELSDIGIAKVITRGNTLIIMPKSPSYEHKLLTIHKELKDTNNKYLKTTHHKKINFAQQKPSVRFTGKGVILPKSTYLSLPIEATNIQSVHVRAFKVYKNNIGQFFHKNKIDEAKELGEVGRFIWDKKIKLKGARPNKKGNYSLDVSQLMKTDPGSLIRLMIYIDRDDSLYECSAKENVKPVQKQSNFVNQEQANYSEDSGWDFADTWNNGGSNNNYNPCNDSYFTNAPGTKDVKNLLNSNIGLIVKIGTDLDKVYVTTTNLQTGQIESNVTVTVYNYQNQKIATSKSDDQGLVTLKPQGKPFYLVAEKDKDVGYLKLTDSLALPTSQFDVSGVHINNSLNGFIYGERDVWRPGDKLFLTFALEDKKQQLPNNYPVTITLRDVTGSIVTTETSTDSKDGLYAFTLQTNETAPVGSWLATVTVGNQSFSKNIAMAMVVPNRLKVELDLHQEVIYKGDEINADIFAQWLYGAKADSLKADINVQTSKIRTTFPRFKDFIFDDVTRSFLGTKKEIFNKKLDAEGKNTFKFALDADIHPSGLLRATFSSRVFEAGGAFSVNSQSVTYSPYKQYIGLKLPKGDAARGMLLTDQDHVAKVIVVDSKGEPLANENVRFSFHKISWKWWWDKSGESLANYASSQSYNLLSEGTSVTDEDGKAQWDFQVKFPDWGRYLVRACSIKSDHCSSKIIYIDWPGWAGRSTEAGNGGIARLTLVSDKTHYQIGDTAIISLPESKNAKMLVSLESGSDVIKQFWVNSSDKQIKVKLDESMVPNTYITVSLIQAHKDRDNDRPIRMMGILNLSVDNPNTHIHPQISLPDEVAPGQKFTIKVKERDQQALSYSLVVVDEGLLGLTGFKTPSLHKYFYKRKGLQVKTWDLFDDVVGAYTNDLERMLDVGGSDEAEENNNGHDKKRRFKPVVQFLGTFTLKKGETKTHEVTLPNYLGAVRVMLIAKHGSQYGKISKSVTVKSPISLLTTLPRTLKTNETISLPVDVFITKENIKDVVLTIDADPEFFDIIKGKEKLTFAAIGEQITEFKIKTKNKQGIGKVLITAKSGQEISHKEINIAINHPNPMQTQTTVKRLKGDEKWTLKLNGNSEKGTSTTSIEFSLLPSMNLHHRLTALMSSPYDDSENVISKGFSQLYLNDLANLTDQEKESVEVAINRSISDLQMFQIGNGSFSYWPGSWYSYPQPWVTTYAMHFLIEAQNKGYKVPVEMLDKLITYQKKEANKTVISTGVFSLNQAYRLFVLAISDNADIAAMSRLKEDPALSNLSKWLLAAGYATIGQQEVADNLSQDHTLEEVKNAVNDETFASDLSHHALVFICASVIGEKDFANELAVDIAAELSSSKWFGSSAISYSFIGFAQFKHSDNSGEIEFTIDNEESVSVDVNERLVQREVVGKDVKQIHFVNTDNSPISVLVSQTGIAKQGTEKAISKTLAVKVAYYDQHNKKIDIRKLKQGQDYVASVSVENKGNLAVNNIVLIFNAASGWQLMEPSKQDAINYQNTRDDKVFTYLALGGKTTLDFTFSFNASFSGKFYLPGITAKAMYDNNIIATTKGQYIEISK